MTSRRTSLATGGSSLSDEDVSVSEELDSEEEEG